ncbi:hypothetical protein BDV95DRAFT_484132 [Massariosphaeria phaeospora]|uniref:Uncharacterized protein n=1 Tax=Massariosphaeria phaeospora TaxID=100035 RepID=A0A7C8IF38_9PLEO|nr:hypothetical protein BDV95DRAFT_484132 [Massariosphaeria phaeospora]
MSPQTPASVTSGASIDSRASLQKRLQKRRPSQPNLPVVQSCQPTEEGTIPDIPANVRSRFTRRLSAAPAMGCLTQTYLSKDHTTSEESVVIDTMTTSSEAPSNLRSTLVADDVIFDHDDEPPTPPLHGRKYGLSLFRTKSTAEKKHKSGHDSSDAVPTVVDLGTIATTLGGSPYDIAMSTIPRKIVVSPTHPHQLGKALPRAKSMVSMDAQTAAELARMRSKDRASLRPAMPKRPKSYQEMNMEAGEGLVLKGRSRNISSEVPPMPAAKLDRLSPSQTSPHHSEENLVAAERKRGSNVRARSSARGPAVSQLIDRYDMNTERTLSPVQPNWDSHALLWGQRCRSIGEGLRQRALDSSVPSTTPSYRAKSQPPEDMIVVDRYSGGLDYGYERGYGIGGSAGTRQLHSSASRKSMHYSNQYGVDLSDVPVFLQRA